jgi:hypothetical protein
MSATVEKAKRTHVNFSKVTEVVDGKTYHFRLTRKGLVIQRKHSPKRKTLSFSQLMDLSIDQRQLL